MSNFNMGMSPDERINKLAQQKMSRAAALENLRASHDNNKQVATMESAMQQQDYEVNKSIDSKDRLSSMADKKKQLDSKKELASLESRIYEEILVNCFESAIISIAYNALPYPDDTKELLDVDVLSEAIINVYEDVIKVCEETDPSTINKDNKLISNMMEVCEAVCKKAVKRISKKATEDLTSMTSLDLSLNEEEEDELSSKITDLGVDEIEELIKQKVIKVVEDEQLASEKKASSMQELEDKISQKESEKEPAGDAGAVKESIEVRMLNSKLTALKTSFGNTIFESYFMESVNSLNNDIVAEGVDAGQEDIMDTAFLESVVKYTTLETMNTLGIINFKKGALAGNINKSIIKSMRK